MRPAQAFVNFFAQAAGAAIVMACIYFVENHFFPVVKDFEITKVERTPGGLTFYGSLVKARPCEFIGLTIYGVSGSGKRSIIHQFRTDVFGANVGLGPQEWGPVTLPAPSAKFEHSEVLATHRCHPLWLQTTIYTTFDMARAPA